MKIKLLITLLIITTNLFSFKLTPITMDYSPQGAESVKYFTVKNPDSTKIALKVELFRRDMDSNGEDILTSAKDDFFVYPRQFFLEGRSEQRIRVQYQGEKELDREVAYRIIVNQIPIEDENNKAGGLRIMYRYIGSIYIRPEIDLSSNVIIYTKSISGDILNLTLLNMGTSHTILKDLNITISNSKTTYVYTPKELEGVEGSNILANTRRDLSLISPIVLDKNIEVTLDYEETN